MKKLSANKRKQRIKQLTTDLFLNTYPKQVENYCKIFCKKEVL